MKQKGITLIALVITIIVLLILAGVTISMVLGDEGIIAQAQEAEKMATRESEIEQLALAAAGSLGIGGKVDFDSLDNNLPTGFVGAMGVYTSLSENMFKVMANGNITILTSLQDISFKISEVQNKVLSKTENVVVTDEYGNIIKVPEGFKITGDAKNVVDGIVVEDCTESATKGSQFVWIPVGTVKIDSEGTTVNNPLERYSGIEATELYSGANDKMYGSNTIWVMETDSKNGAYKAECNVNTAETDDFVSSAMINGGYYIGRYEARTADGQRGSKDDKEKVATDTLTCKANDYLYNYVDYTDALKLSKEMYTGTSFSSNLVNSYAWDTAIKYFETVTGTNYSEMPSVNQGNEDGKIGFCWTGTVGTANEDKICNVYDMASNSYEWTTEDHRPEVANVMRGGVYSSTDKFAGTRRICVIGAGNVRYHTNTFRVVLYLD